MPTRQTKRPAAPRSERLAGRLAVSRTSTKNTQRAATRCDLERPPAARQELARCLLCPSREEVPNVSTANNEINSDDDGYESGGKGAARRRVDAYHEALRERAAMRELEQPFVLDVRTWPPPRY